MLEHINGFCPLSGQQKISLSGDWSWWLVQENASFEKEEICGCESAL